MDKTVFNKEDVGQFVNEHFVSLKLQMDSTKMDNADVVNLYKKAHEIQREFQINSFPTFLFFSPDGKLVHKFIGSIRDSDFIKIAKDALNPDRQFFTLKGKYDIGNCEYRSMGYLATMTKRLGNAASAKVIARNYIEHYLNLQTEDTLRLHKNLTFISSFTSVLSSSDNAFKFLCKDSVRIDSAMYAGFRANVIDDVITKEEINSKLWPDGKPISYEPNWKQLKAIISAKYNSEFADRNIIYAQLTWYEKKEDWNNLIYYHIHRIEKYGLDTVGLAKTYFNNVAYNFIFKHSTNKTELSKTINWMEEILKLDPNNAYMLDTYANLLYKTGSVYDAILIESKAASLNPNNDEIKTNLDKMRKGVATW
jgi:hypothetical protein